MSASRGQAERVRRLHFAFLCKGFLAAFLVFHFNGVSAPGASTPLDRTADVTYTNVIDPRGPWSIHLVRVPLGKGPFEVRSVHARGRAIGLGELSTQVQLVNSTNFEVLAALNGDFYERHGPHAGDPRGLQIIDGELVSAPSGSASFWMDPAGEAHAAITTGQFTVTWPDRSSTPIGLNGSREFDEIQLYTPAMGRSTRTDRGREITLEREGNGPWLPLRAGRTYKAKVRSVHDSANGEIPAGTMVLSIGPSLARDLPQIAPGAILIISTATSPDLRIAKTAISGGPLLVKAGKAQRIRPSPWGGFENTSQGHRHPRSALGWNAQFLFLVEVDGRQRRSAGMTLSELAEFLVALGCTDGVNLDGGGSSTLWYKGRIRNRPCDGDEREIANAIVVGRTPGQPSPAESVAKP